MNNELTVIINSATCCLQSLDLGHPARPLLLDLLAAAQRCAGSASGLLNFCARRNTRAVRASLESLMEG